MAGALPPAPSYLDWMRSVAARLGNPYDDRLIPGSSIALMRGRIDEAYSDAPTPQLSLQLCVSGEYELTGDLGAGRFRARRRAGDLLIAPPHQHIALSGGSRKGIEMLILALDWSAITTQASDCGVEIDLAPLRCGLWRDARLNHLIVASWESAGGASSMMEEELACAIVGHVARLTGTRPRPLIGGLAPWQVKRVMAVLRERLSEELRLADLAALVGLSPFHFARAFRAAIGQPPHQALVALRVEAAAQLLATTRLSVLQIALEVGYGSGQALARAFRRIHGVTPEAYRETRRN